MQFNRISAAFAVLLFPVIASADPCSGASPFTDVPAAAIYCTNTEWLRNRSITLGCTATNYCPDDVVTRASMALFMNRLGAALTPEVFELTGSGSSINLDTMLPGNVFCNVDLTVTGYPRRAVVLATISGLAAGALDFSAQVVVSVNGGLTWTPLFGQNSVHSGAAGSYWTNASFQAVANLNAGDVSIGIHVKRMMGSVPSTANFGAYRCATRAVLLNRNGLASPFDAAGQDDGL